MNLFIEFKPLVKQLIIYYCSLPGNGAGGKLHIVLSDLNVDNDSLDFCKNECQKHHDNLGVFLINVLYEFTEIELIEML